MQIFVHGQSSKLAMCRNAFYRRRNKLILNCLNAPFRSMSSSVDSIKIYVHTRLAVMFEGFQGEPDYWDFMMPRDANLSDSNTPDHCRFCRLPPTKTLLMGKQKRKCKTCLQC